MQLSNTTTADTRMQTNVTPQAHAEAIGKHGLTLFREAALSRHANQAIGTTVLVMPFAFKISAGIGVAIICALVGFVAFGSYTTTETIKTVIEPTKGIEKIYGNGEGMVVELFVNEGDRVKKGDALVSVTEKNRSDASPRNEPTKAPSAQSDEPESEIDPGPAPQKGGTPPPRIIRSPVDGIVYQLRSSPRTPFFDFQEILQIAADGTLSVKFEVSPKSRAGIRKGDRLRFDTIGAGGASETLRARVVSVAQSPTQRYNQLLGTTEYTYTVLCAIEGRSNADDRTALLGAIVESKIPQQKRKLYEWMFDPMKKLFSN